MQRHVSLLFILLFLTLERVSYSSQQTDDSAQKKAVTEQEYDETMFDWTRTWAEVMQLVKRKHYKIVEPEKAMSRAIDAFLNYLDPHSNFLDQKSYSSMMETTSGEFFGIGIVIDNTRKTKDRALTIVEIIPDGPAEKAGLMQYDKIVEIDEKSLEGLTTDEAIKLIKGEKGSKVSLKVIREGQPDLVSVDVTRDMVKTQASLSFYIKNQNIYYLSLTTFSENAITQVENLLKKATKKTYRGIILDLRNNSGGLLHAVITIAGLFLPKGSVIAITKDKHDKVIESYKTKRDPIANNKTPIFILINNYTASAAEILAGCLKIHADSPHPKQNSLVFLVGTPTFGKGSVQEVIPVNNNCAITLTTSLYFLPDNNSIQGIGITPDFQIERYLPPTEQFKWFTQSYGRESTLENYIVVHKNAKNKKDCSKKERKNLQKTWLERAKDMLCHDNQLKETITLINILDSAKDSTPQSITSRSKALEFLKKHYINGEELDIEEIKA